MTPKVYNEQRVSHSNRPCTETFGEDNKIFIKKTCTIVSVAKSSLCLKHHSIQYELINVVCKSYVNNTR